MISSSDRPPTRVARLITGKYRIESSPTGELFEFAASARTAADGRFRFVWTLAPGKRGPSEHYHVDETETFEMVSGALRMWIDGVQHDLEPGDVIVVKPGTPHRFLNAGGTPAVVNVSFDGPRMEDALVPIGVASVGRSPRVRELLRMIVGLNEHRASIPVRGRERWLMSSLARALALTGIEPFTIVRGWDARA